MMEDVELKRDDLDVGATRKCIHSVLNLEIPGGREEDSFFLLLKNYVGRVMENETFYGDGLKPLTSSSYLGCNSTNAGFTVLVCPSAVLPPALIQDWAYFFR